MFFPLKRPRSIFNTAPLHQIINILKMIIKCHPANTAVCCQIVNRNFIKRLLKQQFFQRHFQSLLCHICHLLSPVSFFITFSVLFLLLFLSLFCLLKISARLQKCLRQIIFHPFFSCFLLLLNIFPRCYYIPAS